MNLPPIPKLPPREEIETARDVLRAYAEQVGWNFTVQMDGKTYGGDKREWQIGISIWYLPTEIVALAALVQALEQKSA